MVDDDLSNPTVFVVEDDEQLRDYFTDLFSTVGLSVTAYSSAVEFLRDFEADRIGCVLADVRMPGMNGLELTRELTQRAENIPIILMSGYADVSMAVEGMKAGAVEFFEKPFRDQELLDKVQECIEKYTSIRGKENSRRKYLELVSTLSKREYQVMEKLVSGGTNKLVARELGISPKTVENHRAKVMMKMGANSLAQLVQIGTICGIGTLPDDHG